ncbi:hypothetical protein GW933_04165 [Candidatus Falkowbacteria bacterium]|uniref:Uncharacterized protein n=1 Tax=Candidatus Buchananbacteria bacterium CG10_big_fil_rev_8_21_14_0_10_33_19 TaxID=1974525 RepID=A0A2H0W767_9BACT|nr:hypothetical protein [Candidatus Falkowbacteria bacterium]PIS06470.1 MAG: hypothetical protein COT80_00830 [Candidatus Buchananbacteria bacterium CG10_big_fil_rev_8_21_14_0_10_33_19]
MKASDLKVGLFYWLNVLGVGLVPKSVISKIVSVNDLGDVLTFRVKTFDPDNGQLLEIKSCLAQEFTDTIDVEDIKMLIDHVISKLEQYITS